LTRYIPHGFISSAAGSTYQQQSQHSSLGSSSNSALCGVTTFPSGDVRALPPAFSRLPHRASYSARVYSQQQLALPAKRYPPMYTGEECDMAATVRAMCLTIADNLMTIGDLVGLKICRQMPGVRAGNKWLEAGLRWPSWLVVRRGARGRGAGVACCRASLPALPAVSALLPLPKILLFSETSLLFPERVSSKHVCTFSPLNTSASPHPLHLHTFLYAPPPASPAPPLPPAIFCMLPPAFLNTHGISVAS